MRKPRKSSVNAAEYNERYVDQIRLIKDLRDNYYLPIPEIKKIVKNYKKQSPSNQAVSQFHSKFSRPLDRLLITEVIGRDAFREETGLGWKWISRAIEWGLISPETRDEDEIYSADDVAIGKLMDDMERVRWPKDDFDPEDLKDIANFIRSYVVDNFNKYYRSNLGKTVLRRFFGKSQSLSRDYQSVFLLSFSEICPQAGRSSAGNQIGLKNED